MSDDVRRQNIKDLLRSARAMAEADADHSRRGRALIEIGKVSGNSTIQIFNFPPLGDLTPEQLDQLSTMIGRR